uniref:Activin_recp domain-containing protein n=1 Tax=Heterorhabditis bacteriophora TaxID=37862 RepID=A0A1I7WS09_HETBA
MTFLGWCRGHELWGWCFHNKTSGRFNCDDEGFCVGQEQLKNKKSSGCFQRDNNTVCCCNDADGCNLGFIPISPKYAAGQSCTNQMEEPNDIKMYKPCDDPWCFAFLSADAEGGLTTVHRGCHSRKTVMHHIYKDQHKKFNNNTKWQETEILVAQPTCADITWEAEYLNGTQSMCLDFSFEEDGVDRKGRLCCCRGINKCNERIMWNDEAINKEELAGVILRRAQLNKTQYILHLLNRTIFTAVLLIDKTGQKDDTEKKPLEEAIRLPITTTDLALRRTIKTEIHSTIKYVASSSKSQQNAK